MLRRIIGTLLFVITKDFWPILFLFMLLGPIAFLVILLSPILIVLNGLLFIAFIIYVSNWFRLIRPWPAFREFSLWKSLRNDYFKFKLYFASNEEKELYFNDGIENKNGVIWGFYPHGTLSFTAMFNFVLNPVTSHIRACVHSGGFITPFFGLFLAWLNCIHVTRPAMCAALENKEQIFLSPGGLVESAYQGDRYNKREGFLKIAIEKRATVIPCWFPEERGYFKVWLPLGEWTQPVLHFPFPMFVWGKWWNPLLPKFPPEGSFSRVMIGRKIDFSALESTISIHEAQRLFYDELDRLIALSHESEAELERNFVIV